jgi:hypothetical protein
VTKYTKDCVIIMSLTPRKQSDTSFRDVNPQALGARTALSIQSEYYVYPLFERCVAYKSGAPTFLASHSLSMTRFVLLVLGLALAVSAQYGVPKPPQPGQPAGAEQWLVIF